MDIYTFGSDSLVWNNDDRDWDANPSVREHYSERNIDFFKEFHDFVFDAPAAFYESEMNNILVSPFDSANVISNITNHELRTTYSQKLLSKYPQYYQAQQLEKLISAGECYKKHLQD